MLSQVKKIVSLLLSVVLGEFFLTSCAFAYQGPGTNGVGEPTNCSFTHAYTRVCGDVGGASWHVYNRSTFTPSKLGFNSGIMRDDKRGEISGTCASSTRWIAVYGWDGRTNGPGSSYVQYGPLNYPGQLITPRGNTYSIEYNSSRGAKAYSEITSSNISQTSGRNFSTILLAFLILCAMPRPTNSLITNGLNNSTAISFGRPH